MRQDNKTVLMIVLAEVLLVVIGVIWFLLAKNSVSTLEWYKKQKLYI